MNKVKPPTNSLKTLLMSCDGYSKNALMGNWYEERIAVAQPARDDKEYRSLREKEDEISYITRSNLLSPLERVKRAHPWDTTAVVVDDGFREMKTMNKTFYDPTLIKNYKSLEDCRPVVKTIEPRKNYPEAHTSIQTNKAKNFALVSQSNMQKHVNEVQRAVNMNISDFGSTFRKHAPDHERQFMLTTNQFFYDRPQKVDPQTVIDKEGQFLRTFAGYIPRAESQKGIKMTSALTSEVYKTEKDPQQNTRVQRSWLPYVENSIKVVEQNVQKNETLNASNGLKTTNKLANYRANTSQVHPHDIATSLPMGDGVFSLNSKYMEPGTFRRIKTDVTLMRNKPISKK